ncbi:traB domain-containing protein-like [Planococcus citri]|uniref:traB domain-containing protein-like n=1 Tax=Planococcus citri TaxID=170843 RepID=UPI0031F7EA96
MFKKLKKFFIRKSSKIKDEEAEEEGNRSPNGSVKSPRIQLFGLGAESPTEQLSNLSNEIIELEEYADYESLPGIQLFQIEEIVYQPDPNEESTNEEGRRFETSADVHVDHDDDAESRISPCDMKSIFEIPNIIPRSTITNVTRKQLPPKVRKVYTTRCAKERLPFDKNLLETPTISKSILEELAEFYREFPNLRTEVRILIANKSIVYLLGTNHADPQCPIDVANIITKVKPQTAVIELCAWRACGCPIHRYNIFQTKPEFTFRYLRRVISQIGFLPAMIFFTDAFNEHNAIERNTTDYGGEFAAAARLCDELKNCKIMLGDREIPTTVKRQASAMGNWRGIRITTLVTMALLFKRKMKPLLMRGHQLVVQDPRFYQIVVLERDIFLTYMIQIAASLRYTEDNPHIVAVVGQGHLAGIQSFWGKVSPSILPLILKPESEF